VNASDALALLDYKRRVIALYARARAKKDPASAWQEWRAGRDGIFAAHACSPLTPEARARFGGCPTSPMTLARACSPP